MTATVNITEARATLSRLIERALAGEDVVIARAGKPLVRLQRIQRAEVGADDLALFGQLEGKILLDGTWDEAVLEAEAIASSEASATVIPFKGR